CVQEIPIEYTAEVIYVPSTGGDYRPEDVCLTYIPKGRYVVTSPSFSIFYNTQLWWFPDDGSGPQVMSAIMKTDKVKYGREVPTALISIQVTSELQEFIEVDNIFGVIALPDNTEKTINMEDWLWNEEEERYEYVWDFTNDEGVHGDPREGFYLAEMVVKKKYYKDVRVQTDFGVCYHVGIDLAFDKDPPEYTILDKVTMTVSITDEKGSPLDAGIDSVLVLPDGNIENLLWTPVTTGMYTTSYVPDQEGQYSITVEATGDSMCYLEDTTATFTVKECEEAIINLEISPAVINEPVTFILTVTDIEGNNLSNARIDSEVYLPDCSSITLSWKEEDGLYYAEVTPSEIGIYEVKGTVAALREDCFRGFFDKLFVVEEKKLPDLVILNDDIELFPEPELGNTVTILVTIRNMGNADAECFWVIILINDEVVHREPIGLLAAGESVTLTYEWTVLYSGGNIIEAIVDPWGWMV
ncbi:MAG: hypothetical protein HXS44_05785, partial [Theionarchaea archaeon]|nr:hypothetical protein [Theionarchaea archaeon]